MQSQLLRGQAGRGLQGPAPVRPRRTHVKAVAFLQDRLRLTRRNDEVSQSSTPSGRGFRAKPSRHMGRGLSRPASFSAQTQPSY